MRIAIDLPTLLLDTSLMSVYAAIAMAYVWRVHRREVAVRYWTWGFAVVALGTLLVAMRLQLPALWAIALGNTLVVGGNCLMYAGTAIFVRRAVSWSFVAAVVVATALAMVFWGVLSPAFVPRVAAFSAATSATWLLMSRDLARASGQSPQHVIYRFVAVVYATCAVATIGRAVYVAVTPEISELFVGGAVQISWLMIVQAAVFFSPLGFLLMTSQRLQLRLDRLANEDDLTGVLNRRAFLARALELVASDDPPQRTAMLVLDLDQFKRLNDEHGHAAGDAVLRAFTRAVAMQLRPQDLFARVGGEEFWLLLPDTDPAGAAHMAERLRAAVEDMSVSYGSDRLRTTVSIGIAQVHLGDISGAISAADDALYVAKESGRNRVITA